MNGYELSREWFRWAFENPEKINPNHGALYFYCIEQCNVGGWKTNFSLPTYLAKEAIGIRSYNTYKKTLDDLIAFGFIKMVEVSKNQNTSNIISLVAVSKNDKAHDKAFDKATIMHLIKQSESTGESIDSVYINIKTLKPETLKLLNENASLVDDNLKDWIKNHRVVKVDYEVFEKAWVMYDRKGSKLNSKKQWKKVKESDYNLIFKHIPLYFKTNPDKTYRKDFERYLSSKLWEDKTEQIVQKVTERESYKAWQPEL